MDLDTAPAAPAADRPSRWFDGLEHIRLTIHLLAPEADPPQQVEHRLVFHHVGWGDKRREDDPLLAPIQLALNGITDLGVIHLVDH
ncbi:MAG TPA: hypothetical protein VFY42_08955 [Gemmatimonadales bacterium]|nr:hypothetical protein [Gemmatimonadales bacterium]HEX5993389.1 hypothetical protein [Thermomicrobiales bacterium]